jgi:hypothetical protein
MEMLRDPKLFAKWHGKYGGINQSSLGSLIEEPGFDLDILELTTTEWNALNCDHHHALEVSRAVHLMGNLQAACRRPLDSPIRCAKPLRPLVEMYRSLQ